MSVFHSSIEFLIMMLIFNGLGEVDCGFFGNARFGGVQSHLRMAAEAP